MFASQQAFPCSIAGERLRLMECFARITATNPPPSVSWIGSAGRQRTPARFSRQLVLNQTSGPCAAEAHPQRRAIKWGEWSVAPAEGCSSRSETASIAKRSADVIFVLRCAIIASNLHSGAGEPLICGGGLPINQPRLRLLEIQSSGPHANSISYSDLSFATHPW